MTPLRFDTEFISGALIGFMVGLVAGVLIGW
jgi:F0F1-type ATP synthase assembly protein I